jgi:hypothetical protein
VSITRARVYSSLGKYNIKFLFLLQPTQFGFGYHRECPSGNALFEIEIPVRTFRPAVLTNDVSLLVMFGHEKNRDFMYVFQAQTGVLVHKFIPRYQGAKKDQAGQLIPIPGKQTQIALMDQDKG